MLSPLAHAAVCLFGAFFAVQSVALSAIERTYGLDHSQLGALGFVRGASLCGVVLAAGLLATRYGKRLFLVLGTSILCLAGGSVALSDGYFSLLAGFCAMGAGLGCLEALLSPLVTDLYPEDKGARLNGLHACFSLGLGAAALGAGLLLVEGASWRLLFAALGALAGVLALGFWRSAFPRAAGDATGLRGTAALVRSALFWRLGAVMALTAGVEGGVTFWGAKYVESRQGGSALSGASGIAVFAGLMMCGRLLSSRMLRLLRPAALIAAAAVVGLAGLTGLQLSSGVAASWLFLGLCGVAVGPFWPTLLALASDWMPRAPTTLLYALLATCGIAGYSIFPWCIGLLADAAGLAGSFTLMAIALLATIGLLLRAPAAGGHSGA